MTLNVIFDKDSYWIVSDDSFKSDDDPVAGPFPSEEAGNQFKAFLVEEETYTFSPYYCADDDKQPSANIEDSVTDPYGHITWAIGNDMDFICFDWSDLAFDHYALHSVCNSESGSFIQDYDYQIVHKSKVIDSALTMLDKARSWCGENSLTTIDDNGIEFLASLATHVYGLECCKIVAAEKAHQWATRRYGRDAYTLALVYEYIGTDKPITLKTGVKRGTELVDVLTYAKAKAKTGSTRISPLHGVVKGLHYLFHPTVNAIANNPNATNA